MKLIYQARIIEEGKAFLVSFPDLPEAITEGATLEEALFNASEALSLTLEGRAAEGMEIPAPSVFDGSYAIAPSARVQSALLLRQARLATPRQSVDLTKDGLLNKTVKLEDPSHWPTLRQVEQAAALLGKRLVISLEP